MGLLSKDRLDSAPASLCWKLAWLEEEAEGAELRCRKKATSCADKLRCRVLQQTSSKCQEVEGLESCIVKESQHGCPSLPCKCSSWRDG